MNYNEWEDEVLRQESSDLVTIVERFKASDARVLHVDRHVWEPLEQPFPLLADVETKYASCRAGIAILRRWTAQHRGLASPDILLSHPFLVVDHEWMSEVEDATPPHIYVCIARGLSDFAPVSHEALLELQSTGDPNFDALISTNERIWIINDGFDDTPSAWIIKVG